MNERRDTLALPVWVLALLLLLFALKAAHEVVVPLVLSILLSLTLAPAVRALIAVRLPRALATLIVVAAGLLVAFSVFYMLAAPAQSWMERAPAALRKLEFGLSGLLEPIEAASEATESLMSLGDDGEQKTVVATTTTPTLALLSRAPALAASFLATVFLTALFLLHGDALLRKFVALVPGLSQKKELVAGTREAQRELSMYLVTISAINLALGLATAATLYYLGVDDPLLWGSVAGLLNFAPYVGAALTAVLLIVVGFAQFAEPLQALAPSAAFVALNLLEAYLVTPLMLGKRLALDPVVIFVAIMLFGYLWGMTGMLIAVPLLACIRIVATRVGNGGVVAQLIGDTRTEPEAEKTEPPPAPSA